MVSQEFAPRKKGNLAVSMNYIVTGPVESDKVLILAHGAGSMMDHEWMNNVCEMLAERDIKVIRFEFPYMQERRETGKKRPPNTKKVLLQTWADVISEIKESYNEIYIGGKSMGGRMASLLEFNDDIKGLVCLGFPFHAPGKDPKDRIIHLESMATPTLIVQGERDTMGTRNDIAGYTLSSTIEVVYVNDGDHSLKPRVKSGYTLEQNLVVACDRIKSFMKQEM